MKVKLRTMLAGPGGNYEAGTVLSERHVSRETLLELVRSGQGKLMKGPASVAAIAPPVAETASAEPEVEAAGELPKWPLKMSPERYLARHPNGQHAELAKLHV